MNEILECKCGDCNKITYAYKEDVTDNEFRRMHLTCMYDGRHKNIRITGRYENIKELMEQKCGVNC